MLLDTSQLLAGFRESIFTSGEAAEHVLQHIGQAADLIAHILTATFIPAAAISDLRSSIRWV